MSKDYSYNNITDSLFLPSDTFFDDLLAGLVGPPEEEEDKSYNGSSDYNGVRRDHYFAQEWERINKQKSEGLNFNPGYFKIGTVALTVPPSQITISDVKNNFTYSTLRAKGDITFQSGHTTKIIELDIIFHDLESINKKLRPLLAQLKCTPFFPMENEYIQSVLFPDKNRVKGLAKSGSKEVENIKESMEFLNSEIKKRNSEMKLEINKVKFYENDVMSSQLDEFGEPKTKDQVFKERISVLIDGGFLDGVGGSVDSEKSIYENISNELKSSGCDEASRTDEGRLLNKIKDLEQKREDLRANKSDYYRSVPDTGSIDFNMAGVLSQITISTIPDLPESLACHMTIFVFNYLPYTPNFMFRKSITRKSEEGDVTADNEMTKNIDECDSFVKWYSKRFLSDNEDAVKLLKNPVSDNISFETVRRARGVESDTDDASSPGKEIDLDAILFLDISDFTTAKCISLSVSFSNRIKFLPIIGYGTPTCQYLGSNSANVSATFTSFAEHGKEFDGDIFLKSLRYFFEHVDATSRETIKDGRKSWVTIKNGLLDMCGIKDLIIQSFDVNTVPGSPGMSISTLRFIDINTTIEQREKIVLRKEVNDRKLEAFIDVEREKRKNGQPNIIDECLSEIKDGKPGSQLLSISKKEGPERVIKTSVQQFVIPYYIAAASDLGYTVKVEGERDKQVSKDYIKDSFISNTMKILTPPIAKVASGAKLGILLSDGLLVKKPHKFESGGSGFEVLDQSTKRDILNKFLYKWESDKIYPQSSIESSMKLLLFRSTKKGQEYMDKWSDLIKDSMVGAKNLPPEVAKIIEKDNLGRGSDPAWMVYEDMSLPKYSEIGISYSPNYSDLGPEPPIGRRIKSLARNEDDIVEPDFYFNHFRVKSPSTSTFSFDMMEWGNKKISYDSIIKEADSIHERECSDLIEQADKNIKDSGTFQKQESDLEEEELKLSGGDGSVVDRRENKEKSNAWTENLLPGQKYEATVVAVEDGDTIVVSPGGEASLGVLVRIIGVDTPEMNFGKKNPDGTPMAPDPGAVEATEFTRDLLLGKKVKVSTDIINLYRKNKDVFDRALLSVDLDGRDFSEILLKEGLAEATGYASKKGEYYSSISRPKYPKTKPNTAHLGSGSHSYRPLGIDGEEPDRPGERDELLEGK